MNMMKKNGGFTLVELIVVIAILAILAGVAVPAYSGYLTKAKDAAVLTELDAVKTAAFAAKATDTTPVTVITVNSDGSVYVNTDLTNAVDLDPFYTDANQSALATKMDGTTYDAGAVWNASGTNAGWTAKAAG